MLPGLWHQADQPTDDGAKLFNVAISRARDRLVIVGDLAWLDRKLPATSLLRQWLHQMQDLGSVVDARSILAMWPMAEDLRRYGKALAVDLDAARTGIFDEKDFLAVVQLDMARAKQGIAIWSAFVTPQGVARIADLLREGVHPDANGLKAGALESRPADIVAHRRPEDFGEAMWLRREFHMHLSGPTRPPSDVDD